MAHNHTAILLWNILNSMNVSGEADVSLWLPHCGLGSQANFRTSCGAKRWQSGMCLHVPVECASELLSTQIRCEHTSNPWRASELKIIWQAYVLLVHVTNDFITSLISQPAYWVQFLCLNLWTCVTAAVYKSAHQVKIMALLLKELADRGEVDANRGVKTRLVHRAYLQYCCTVHYWQ